jgi:hypothetical protein
MKKIIFILILMYSKLSAQESIRFMNVHFGLQSSYTNVNNFVSKYTPPSANLDFTYSVKGAFSYGIFIGTEIKISNPLRLRLQFMYHTLRYKGIIDGLHFGSDYDPFSQTFTSSMEKLTRQSNTISTPVSIIYYFGKGRRFYFGVNTTPYYQLQERTQTAILYGNGIKENWGSKKDNTKNAFRNNSLKFFTGYKRQITPLFAVSIEPFFEIDPKVHNIDADLSTARFSNIGLSVLLSKSVNKAEAQCYKF